MDDSFHSKTTIGSRASGSRSCRSPRHLVTAFRQSTRVNPTAMLWPGALVVWPRLHKRTRLPTMRATAHQQRTSAQKLRRREPTGITSLRTPLPRPAPRTATLLLPSPPLRARRATRITTLNRPKARVRMSLSPQRRPSPRRRRTHPARHLALRRCPLLLRVQWLVLR